jgi:hypothetical protein
VVLEVPEEGLIEFPREELSVHDVAALVPTVSIALLPEVTEAGPDNDAVAPDVSVTTATASSPSPHDVVARPE